MSRCLDGGHINCLLSVLFLYHLPELLVAGKVYCAVPPLYKVTKGKKSFFTSDFNVVTKETSQGADVSRLKGLGEMGAQELWDTTMNPETRNLIQLKPTNIEEMKTLFDIMMGGNAGERRKFIMQNARKYKMEGLDSADGEGDAE